MDLLRCFLRDRGGNVAIIVAFLLMPMLVLAGGATDMARYEMHRVQLQDGVDRAVLAAASLRQSLSVEEAGQEFLKSISFIDAVALDYDYVAALNDRQVTLTGRYDMPTTFLTLIGINTLPIVATATAQENRSNIELSLMLDFSGSMVGAKYTSLKSAATDFIRTMVTSDTSNYTTVNMVPYAGQVSLGPYLFGRWGAKRNHNHSSCVEIYRPDYGSGIISLMNRKQVPHFTVWNASNFQPFVNPAWCPSDDTAVTLVSNDADALVSRIEGYRMYDGTGTAIALNWGLKFLDPTMRPWVQDAVSVGLVNPAFSDRPAPFDDDNTLKVIVLMTDGAINEQKTAKNPNADVRTNNNHIPFIDPIWGVSMDTNRNVAMFNQLCSESKALGVIVFTIGFQIGDSTTRSNLRNCATSSSHYFDVQGLNISSAFEAIANNIQKLKLTQ